MTFERLIEYLISTPEARERRFKDKHLVELLRNKYQGKVDENLVDICKDFDSLNRYWRLALAQNPKLRGEDYNNKKHYQDQKQISLGYDGFDYKAFHQKMINN